MLYVYIHTHSAERCIADKAGTFVEKYGSPLRQDAEKAGIKIIANYVAPQEHKIFIVFDVPDGKDIWALGDSIRAWTVWGNAQLVPVISFAELNT